MNYQGINVLNFMSDFFEFKVYFIKNSFENYNFVLKSKDSMILFDPLLNSYNELLIDNLNCFIGITHHHRDHIWQYEHYKKSGFQDLICKKNNHINFDNNIQIKSFKFKGHCEEDTIFAISEHDRIFIILGDLIFQGGVGNTKNGGNMNELYESIKELIEYLLLLKNKEIILCPSHDYLLKNIQFTKQFYSNPILDKIKLKKESAGHFLTTLQEELTYNLFLSAILNRLDDETKEKIKEKYHREFSKESSLGRENLSFNNGRDYFIALRLMRDQF